MLGADGASDNLVDSGQQLSAASIPVVLASDHSDVKITLDGETVTVASHAVTNAGTFAVQVDGAALTALQLIDNLVLTEDLAHQSGDSGIQMLAIRDDTLNIRSGAENDYEPLHTDANGALWVRHTSDAITVASHAVTNAGTFAVQVDGAALTALQNADTDLTTIIGHVDGLEGLIGTTNTNTGNAATSLAILDDWDNGASDGASVSGDVAHDTADAGEPVKLGFKAIDIGTQPTAVTANDRSNWYGNRNGVPWVMGGSPAILTQELNITDADGAQTDTAIVTVSAGTAIVVTAFQAMCDGANTGDVAYRVGFGTANTPAADAAGIVSSHPGVKPGSGVVIGNGSGAIGMGASNEDLRVTCEDPAGGAVSFIVSYFTVLIG